MSEGQKVLEAVERWIGQFVKWPDELPGQGMLAAVWCLHTWLAPRWPVTTYLFLTSDGPGAGKTTALEVLASLSLRPRITPTLRPLSVVRDLAGDPDEGRGPSEVTYFFDQVEELAPAARVTDARAILLSGYRKGGSHIVLGKQYPTYGPKAFASIGAIAADVESRCLVLRLSMGRPERNWPGAIMERGAEAADLVRRASSVLASLPPWIMPEIGYGWSSRDLEIMTPLHSVIMALNLDAAAMERWRSSMDDQITWSRSRERREYRDLIRVERDAEAELAERCLRDLASVLPERGAGVSGDLWSVSVVERLRAGSGPWRVIKGEGLTPLMLAGLLGRFGLRSSVVREGRGRLSKQANGYKGSEVRAALAKLDEGR